MRGLFSREPGICLRCYLAQTRKGLGTQCMNFGKTLQHEKVEDRAVKEEMLPTSVGKGTKKGPGTESWKVRGRRGILRCLMSVTMCLGSLTRIVHLEIDLGFLFQPVFILEKIPNSCKFCLLI